MSNEKLKVKLIKQLRKEFGFIERRFLNRGLYHSTAAIVGKINIDNLHYDYANLHISDCSRTIDLDMDTSTKEDINNSIYKLEQIIAVCSNMKKALEKMKNIQPIREKYQKQIEEN